MALGLQGDWRASGHGDECLEAEEALEGASQALR